MTPEIPGCLIIDNTLRLELVSAPGESYVVQLLDPMYRAMTARILEMHDAPGVRLRVNGRQFSCGADIISLPRHTLALSFEHHVGFITYVLLQDCGPDANCWRFSDKLLVMPRPAMQAGIDAVAIEEWGTNLLIFIAMTNANKWFRVEPAGTWRDADPFSRR